MKNLLISLLALIVLFVSGCVTFSSPNPETSSQVETDRNLSSCKPYWTDYYND